MTTEALAPPTPLASPVVASRPDAPTLRRDSDGFADRLERAAESLERESPAPPARPAQEKPAPPAAPTDAPASPTAGVNEADEPVDAEEAPIDSAAEGAVLDPSAASLAVAAASATIVVAAPAAAELAAEAATIVLEGGDAAATPAPSAETTQPIGGPAPDRGVGTATPAPALAGEPVGVSQADDAAVNNAAADPTPESIPEEASTPASDAPAASAELSAVEVASDALGEGDSKPKKNAEAVSPAGVEQSAEGESAHGGTDESAEAAQPAEVATAAATDAASAAPAESLGTPSEPVAGDSAVPPAEPPEVTASAPTGATRSGSPGLAVGEARGAERAGDAPTVDPARFVTRVARAIDFASERGGGPIEMRLSPPDLGSLHVKIELRDGVLTASLEAETPAARQTLLDNLPALRERLEQQQVRIEKFDVEVRDDRQQGGDWRQQQDQQESRDRQSESARPGATRSTEGRAAKLPIATAAAVSVFGPPGGINLVA